MWVFESISGQTKSEIAIDLAIAEAALTVRSPPEVIEGPSSLDGHLVDLLFEEDPELLSPDNGFGGNV